MENAKNQGVALGVPRERLLLGFPLYGQKQLDGIACILLGYDGGQLVDYFPQRRGPRKNATKQP